MFYVLTDGAADGLKKLILRLREKRFDPSTGQREYQFLLTEEFVSLLTAEKYGMLLIMEQAKGTRYEGLRASLIDMLAAKTAPMLADEDNSMLLAQIMARNLIDGMVMVLKNRVRPREIRTNLNRLVEYHTKGIDALQKSAEKTTKPAFFPGSAAHKLGVVKASTGRGDDGERLTRRTHDPARAVHDRRKCNRAPDRGTVWRIQIDRT